VKLNRLRQKVYENWSEINHSKRAIATKDFKDDVRKNFGDLRRKDTWSKALARYYAHTANIMCLDAWSLILYTLNFTPDSEYYEFRHLILDEFLMFPDGLDLIRMGLEQLQANFDSNERKEAHGFFELVAEQQQRGSATFTDRRVPRLVEA
jgi:hypothetical protein